MVGGGFPLIAIFQTPIFARIVLCVRSISRRVIIERIAKLTIYALPKVYRLYAAVLARSPVVRPPNNQRLISLHMLICQRVE
jgi:hypothetical protein